MRPITKAEVDEAFAKRVTGFDFEADTLEQIKAEGSLLLPAGWLLIGYEIARRRVEKGDEL